MAYSKCPICNGNGLVSNGFYNQTSGTWSSSSTAFEQCKSCNGQGVIKDCKVCGSKNCLGLEGEC